jgi:thiol-disulfide isomerase/thioredoxin
MKLMNISRPKRKTIIQIILVILAIFVIRLWQQQDLIEGNVPSFTSTSLTGESLSSKPWPNEPLLIHFWATWCPICEMENDNIQNVAKDYRTLNIAIQSGSDKEITEYANKNNLKLDNIINDRSGTLATFFGVTGTPTSFIISPSGKISSKEVGYMTELGLRFRLWWSTI